MESITSSGLWLLGMPQFKTFTITAIPKYYRKTVWKTRSEAWKTVFQVVFLFHLLDWIHTFRREHLLPFLWEKDRIGWGVLLITPHYIASLPSFLLIPLISSLLLCSCCQYDVQKFHWPPIEVSYNSFFSVYEDQQEWRTLEVCEVQYQGLIF